MEPLTLLIIGISIIGVILELVHIQNKLPKSISAGYVLGIRIGKKYAPRVRPILAWGGCIVLAYFCFAEPIISYLLLLQNI